METIMIHTVTGKIEEIDISTYQRILLLAREYMYEYPSHQDKDISDTIKRLLLV